MCVVCIVMLLLLLVSSDVIWRWVFNVPWMQQANTHSSEKAELRQTDPPVIKSQVQISRRYIIGNTSKTTNNM